jgi:hypothetical protein
MLDQAEKRAVEQNLAQMNQESEDNLAKMKQNLANMKQASEDELVEPKKERNGLIEEVAMLKDCQKHEEEMTQLRMHIWEKEREKLKEEKKKLEFCLYDLLKASDVHKDRKGSSKSWMNKCELYMQFCADLVAIFGAIFFWHLPSCTIL